MRRKIAAIILALLALASVLAFGQGDLSAPIPDSVKARHKTLFSSYFDPNLRLKNIEQETLDGHDVDTGVGRDVDYAMDPKGAEESRQNPYPNMNLRGISCDADAVAVAVPTFAESDATADGRGLFTDYRFVVKSALKNTTMTKLENSSIIVTRPGGQATINGRSVRVTIYGFPLYVIGQRYLLFLGHLKTTNTFQAFNVGSFELKNGSVTPFDPNIFPSSVIVSLNSETTFLAEVRAALRASCAHQHFPGLEKEPG